MKRILLLVLLPMLLVQVFSFYIFFKRYLERVSRKNLEFLATEIFSINKQFDTQIKIGLEINEIVNYINDYSEFKISFAKGGSINEKYLTNRKKYKVIFFTNQLLELSKYVNKSIVERTSLYKKNKNFILEIEKNMGVLTFDIKSYKLRIMRIDLVIFWNILSFFFVSTIAVLFAKNQIRSINELKNFINDFSFLEKENNNFKPRGAKEIREMGKAVLNIINKMKYLLNSRTVMLAQISHDLRTPLTRMKLQTEFIEDKIMADFFKKDLNEMEELINEYILFAKGEINSEYTKINIKKFFDDIINDYKRNNYNNITIDYNLANKTCFVKQNSLKRAINNLINNSLRYSKKKIMLNIETTKQKFLITVEDDGEGVLNKDLKNIGKPAFVSNKDSSGNGLGLSIVQQIVVSHRGTIEFLTSKKLGGLKIIITIPLNNKNDKNVARNKK
jgi:two-component system osmolarity sensor histidine kinase EnvZ